MATLLAEHGLTVDDLDELLVAGAFGNHIEVESAQTIGLYPGIPRERIRQIGNAAGTGAGLMLLSMAERQDAEESTSRSLPGVGPTQAIRPIVCGGTKVSGDLMRIRHDWDIRFDAEQYIAQIGGTLPKLLARPHPG